MPCANGPHAQKQLRLYEIGICETIQIFKLNDFSEFQTRLMNHGSVVGIDNDVTISRNYQRLRWDSLLDHI